VNNSRSHIPNIIIANSLLLRFDIFKGTFTKNDQLIASPYNDSFAYIPNVPLSVAKQVPDEINKNNGKVTKRKAKREENWEERMWRRGYVDHRFDE
jgi:hypothetical protein